MASLSDIPAQLVAGDSWAWRDCAAYASHPPPDWAVTYVLRPASGGAAITIVGTWIEGCYSLTRAAAETATAPPGEYLWTALARHDASDLRERIGAGRVDILPDPEQASGDMRTTAERTLAAISATLEGRATKDADSYTIEGRSIARTPLADLLRLQSVYERRVMAERNPGTFGIQQRRVKF